MCNPQLIAVAIAAVGTGLQVKAQNERDADARRLNRQETERIDKHYAESSKYRDENQGNYERSKADADMALAAAARQDQYAAADRNAPRANESAGSKSTNSVVQDAFARAVSGAQAEAAKRGAARANLASFNDFMTDTALTNLDNSNRIGMVGSFQRGSASVLPLELQHAMTKTRGSATLGNLLMGLSSAMSNSGAGASSNTNVNGQTMSTNANGASANNLFGAYA